MKRKRISKKMLYTILGVLTIFVSTLTVAYSVLSATLNITGRAAVTNSSWNITVSKRDVLESVGYSEEELERILSFLDGKRIYNGIVLKSAELIKEPTISGTTISDLKIAFNKPGDVLALMYNVTNNGTIPAKIESIVQNTPSFSSSINNEYDIELISSAFSFCPISEYITVNISFAQLRQRCSVERDKISPQSSRASSKYSSLFSEFLPFHQRSDARS